MNTKQTKTTAVKSTAKKTTTKRRTAKDKALDIKQQKIDYDKWLESEKKHQDMCGTYDFCKYCNKDEENPCAKAVEAISKALNETAYVSKKA